MKILFVCLGNICRSPLAAGILQEQTKQLGLDWQINSAGLANKYIGCTADPRVVEVAKRHGIDLSHHIARKFQVDDFNQYDMVITMDDDLAKRLRDKAFSLSQADKVWILPDFLDGLAQNIDMPDPYFWDIELFESLYSKMEQACQLIVETYNVPDILELFDSTMTENATLLAKRA